MSTTTTTATSNDVAAVSLTPASYAALAVFVLVTAVCVSKPLHLAVGPLPASLKGTAGSSRKSASAKKQHPQHPPRLPVAHEQPQQQQQVQEQPQRSRRIRLTLNLATAPPLGVLVLLASRVLSLDDVKNGIVGDPDGIQPYTILILIFSLAYICISIDETGLFRYIAYRITQSGGSSGWRLYFYLFTLSAVMTIFTSNDVVALTVTPILCYFAKSAKIDATPYLISGFIVSNITSMALFVGNPTNVIVSQAASISIVRFSAVMALPTLLAVVASLAATTAVFWRSVPVRIGDGGGGDGRGGAVAAVAAETAAATRDTPRMPSVFAVTDPVAAGIGCAVLVACLTSVMVVPVVAGGSVGVWAVTLPFAAVLALYDLVVVDRLGLRGGGGGAARADDATADLPAAAAGAASLSEDVDGSFVADNNQDAIEMVGGFDGAAAAAAVGKAAKPDDGHPGNFSFRAADDADASGTPTGGSGDGVAEHSADFLVSTPSTLERGSLGRASAAASLSIASSAAATPRPAPHRPRFQRTWTVLRRLPYTLVPFSLGMFVLVQGLDARGWTGLLAEGLGRLQPFSAAVFGTAAATTAACTVLNNLPMTMLFARALQHPLYASAARAALSAAAGVGGTGENATDSSMAAATAADAVLDAAVAASRRGALFGLVVGSNVGANLLFVGSLAGLMWSGVVKSRGAEVRQAEFLWRCLGVTPFVVAAACAGLVIVGV
ncbi:citrate transporter-domain-containing protein [Zopfochytrium polystomum]|nr:citrate transporter-domain-containing protein [Zopfochytrium polystomum]